MMEGLTMQKTMSIRVPQEEEELLSQVFKAVRDFPKEALLSIARDPGAAARTLAGLGKQAQDAPSEEVSFERRMSQQLAKLLANMKKAVSYFDPDLVDRLDRRMNDEHDPAENQLREWSYQLNRLGRMYFQAVREKQEHLAELQQEAGEWGQYAEQLKRQALKGKAEWEAFARQANEWGQDLLDAVGLLKSLDTAQFKERFIRYNTLRQPRIIEAANEIIEHLDATTKKDARWRLLGNGKLKF
jgi:hypothetical protein